jgi:hypothetical protein
VRAGRSSSKPRAGIAEMKQIEMGFCDCIDWILTRCGIGCNWCALTGTILVGGASSFIVCPTSASMPSPMLGLIKPAHTVLTMPRLRHHCRPQNFVQSALIALALRLQPLQYIGINSYRQLSLEWSIELPSLRSAPVFSCSGGQIGKVNFAFWFGCQCCQFFANCIRYLAHKFSFLSWWLAEPK